MMGLENSDLRLESRVFDLLFILKSQISSLAQ